MAARENQHISVDKANAAHHAIGSQGYLFRRLASRGAVTEQLPVRTLLANVCTAATLIVAVIPFDQILVHLSHIAETCQFAGTACPLQGAGRDQYESHPLQPFPEAACCRLSMLGERKVGQAGMLTGQAPSGFAVPCQVECWKCVIHDLSWEDSAIVEAIGDSEGRE